MPFIRVYVLGGVMYVLQKFKWSYGYDKDATFEERKVEKGKKKELKKERESRKKVDLYLLTKEFDDDLL